MYYSSVSHPFYVFYPVTLVFFNFLYYIFSTLSISLISVFLILPCVLNSKSFLKNVMCAAPNFCLLLCFMIQSPAPYFRADLDVTLRHASRVSYVNYLPKRLLMTPLIPLNVCMYILHSTF